MISQNNLERSARSGQTTMENVSREYCQHLFLSYLYRIPGSERLLFKGGTALRIVFGSPRFSEDLDFTGRQITTKETEGIITESLSAIERSGIKVEIGEAKKTSGGYLAIIFFFVYEMKIKIQVEVSFRQRKTSRGTRAMIVSDLVPAYTLVHMEISELIDEKVSALFDRQKPRDFYDYLFLLSGNYSRARNTNYLRRIRLLLAKSKIDFRGELKKFLPIDQNSFLRDFRGMLERKIQSFL